MTLDLVSPRIANAEEIEITAEMVEAGVAALEFYRGAYADGALVREVYSAMRLCALEENCAGCASEKLR